MENKPPELVDADQYNKQVKAIRDHYHKTWVQGAEAKAASRIQQIDGYQAKLDEAIENVELLIGGHFDDRFKRPSDKDNALERYIDNIDKYRYYIDKTNRELAILSKHIPAGSPLLCKIQAGSGSDEQRRRSGDAAAAEIVGGV